MNRRVVLSLVTICLLLFSRPGRAAEESGWQSLFDGKSLDGWVNVNTADETWSVRDGMIVCSGQPIGFLRTTKRFENYVLELEWRHMTEGGNAGVMVHADPLPQVGAPYPESVEVQVMDGDGGSMFGIRGCTLTPITNPRIPKGRGHIRARPTENRAKPAGQWNHYRLTSRDGSLELAVNGEVVTRAKEATQVAGHICLESERSEVHFRNIRIKELASSNPPEERVADPARGLKSLFNGISLAGWKTNEQAQDRWSVGRGILRLRDNQRPRGRENDASLWTKKEFDDFLLVADWRLTNKPVRQPMNTFTDDGLLNRGDDGKVIKREIRHAGDSGIFLRGDRKAQVNIWSQPMGSGDINPYHKDKSLSPEIRRATLPRTNADKPFGQWNRFEIEMRGDRVSVTLNGTNIIDNALLPDVADSGPIGLQNHGDAIQFDNLYLKRLSNSSNGGQKPGG